MSAFEGGITLNVIVLNIDSRWGPCYFSLEKDEYTGFQMKELKEMDDECFRKLDDAIQGLIDTLFKIRPVPIVKKIEDIRKK